MHPLHGPPSPNHDHPARPPVTPFSLGPSVCQPLFLPLPLLSRPLRLPRPAPHIPPHSLTSTAIGSSAPRGRLQRGPSACSRGDCNYGAVRLAVVLASAAPAIAYQVEAVIGVDCAHALDSFMCSPQKGRGLRPGCGLREQDGLWGLRLRGISYYSEMFGSRPVAAEGWGPLRRSVPSKLVAMPDVPVLPA